MSFGKRLTLDVGSVRVRYADSAGLRVTFDVDRDRSRDPNSCEIRIWNLAPSTRKGLEEAPRLACRLTAGYADDGEHQVFAGVLLHAVTERSGPDRVTVLTLGDEGEQRTALARIQRTFPAGTPISTVLSELVRATGLGGGNLAQASIEARLAGSLMLPRAWTASGQALTELNAFARSLGFGWTIQDQEVFFTGMVPGTANSGPLLSAGTGLAPSTSVDANGLVTVESRLIPDLVPGRPFLLQSEAANGIFVATKTKHYGDTHGSEWSVIAEGEPIERTLKRGTIVNA